MELEFKRGTENFRINVYNCSFIDRFSGLMFTRKENAKALLFKFRKNSNISLHSLFVFFDFLVIWLDNKDNLVDMKICKPWKFYINTEKNFSKVLEIPFNKKYSKILQRLT